MFSKIEKFVFLALVFSIPFQKRFFLFGPSPEGEGFFEWSSGFLYFTDILVIFLFTLWARNMTRNVSSPWLWPLIVFAGFAFISLTQADLVDVGVYRFIKLAEFIFIFFYVASRARIIGIKPILGAFVASGIFQSILAILQFAKQSSLGLEIFHESILEIGLKGVAEISVGGMEFIRAYGTFPSPNVLAGFLGICLFFAFYLFLKSSNPRENNPTSPLIYGIAIFLLSFGLMLTFSRGVIVFFVFTTILFFAGIFLLEKLKQYRKQASRLAVLVIVSWLFIVAAAWPEVSSRFLESSVGEPAIQERLFFNEVGLDTVRQNYPQLFFGVGMGNFVPYYMQSLPGLEPHLYQPVHNIFILIASEVGILGLIAFVVFLASLFKKSLQSFFRLSYTHDREQMMMIFSLFFIFHFLFFISLYDHYFWTLQQGGLMFWISLGLLAGGTRYYNKRR